MKFFILNIFRFLIAVLAMVACLVSAGCKPAAEKAGGIVEPPAIVKEYGQDFLSLRVTIDRQKITTAQRLQVNLTGTTAENFVIEFPEAGDGFGNFTVVGIEKLNPTLTAEGRVAVQQNYTLEPAGPGVLTLPALLVSSWEKGLEEARVIEVSTEEFQVTVDSLLPEGEAGAKLSDIAPPVAQPWNRILLAVVFIGVLMFLALLIYFWRRRSGKKDIPPPPVPPHLRAYQALDALLTQGFIEQGEFKLFYEKVSNILRHYIEHRFGLKAPERTTEEFLAELGGVQPFSGSKIGGGWRALTANRGLLQDFLSHCDLVKFAKHHPEKAEVEMSVSLCRKFIKETEPVVEQAAAAAKGDTPPLVVERGAV